MFKFEASFESVEALQSFLAKVTGATNAKAVEPPKSEGKKAAAKQEPAATQPIAEEPAAQEPKAINYDKDIKPLFLKLVAKSRPDALSMLTKYGCKANLVETPAEKFPELLADINGLLAA